MPDYSFETYGELSPAIEQEWLLTNGTGAYASGTVVGCNTRRYHGLLCATTLPPVGRVMLLNRVAEIVTVGGESFELSINHFGDALQPRGDHFLRHFSLGRCVTWAYEARGVRVTKEAMLLRNRNVVAIRYTVESSRKVPVEVALLPFVSLCDFHSLRRAPATVTTESSTKHVRLCDEQSEHAVSLSIDHGQFQANPDWWYGHTYPLETERGLDHTEDLFTPGQFIVTCEGRTTFMLVAAIGDVGDIGNVDWDTERKAHETAEATAISDSHKRATHTPAVQRLMRAAGDFIVTRPTPDGRHGTTIIAGYPWFADWGRDTMISLPGLLLCTGRHEQAKQVLAVFAQYVSEGMIPNRFDDYTNVPEYNTVDASLWFIHACYEYVNLTKDNDTFTRTLKPACDAIIDGYQHGTRFGIRMDEADGLITQGDATTQLTWMDAKCGDIAFTPRQGKPVEINALWYHALRLTGRNALAERVKESFVRTFWISPFRGLADVVTNGRRDTTIRPNQIFAVSLPNTPLTRDQQLAVVEVVRRELLTAVGLRTLSPTDPNFKPRYTGPQFDRDTAYHNGTIWPWLMGAFLDAYLRAKDHSLASISLAKEWLLPLIEGMHHTACIGQISEIYEATEPHRPVGCYAQAWSIAEVLRLAMKLGI